MNHKEPLNLIDPIPLQCWDEFHEAEAEWKKRLRQADIEDWGADESKYTDEDKQLCTRIKMWIDAHTPKPVKPEYCTCIRQRGSYRVRAIDGVCVTGHKPIQKLK